MNKERKYLKYKINDLRTKSNAGRKPVIQENTRHRQTKQHHVRQNSHKCTQVSHLQTGLLEDEVRVMAAVMGLDWLYK
jgi:hypothetical protein